MSDNFPCKSCKAECCHSPSMLKSEYDVMRIKYPKAPLQHLFGHIYSVGYPGDRCWFLKGNRCSIYEDRPIVCQRFGLVKELSCPKQPFKNVPPALKV